MNPYKELVVRYIDRMMDRTDDDTADSILDEFILDFEVLWSKEETPLDNGGDDDGDASITK